MSLCLGLFSCGYPTADDEGPPATRFASPLVGRPMEELFYGAYLDQGSRDYSCGSKYYPGHAGTDILLRNFLVQDSGVTVVAAAAGQVTDLRDGEPDRHAAQSALNRWNFVRLRHADGVSSIYGHLRRGSIRVSLGQEVAAGAALGLVGSSGFSNWPHLHFEVHNAAGQVLDPWQGACSPGASRWASQLAYQNEFRVIDMGVQDRRILGSADLLERPADSPVITGANGVMSFWIELFNVRAEVLEGELLDPSGRVAHSIQYSRFLTFSMALALVTVPVTPDLPAGIWTAVFRMIPLGGSERVELGRREFTLVPPPAGLRAPGAGTPARPEIRIFTPGNDTP